MEYNVEFLPVDELKPYENNAKLHPDAQVERIAMSISQFGFRQNLVIDKNNCVIIGHGRLLAAQRLGLEAVPCVRVEDLTEEQIKALRLADNKVAESDWDTGLLEMELADITGIDMSQFGFLDDIDCDFSLDEPEEGRKQLADAFLVPPFSVLDTRQGYWQERKREWLKITGNLSETRDGDFGTIGNAKNNMLASINGGTSNFDPVLAEVMYKWFNVEGGHILDPFGGEQTKGVVAGECGYKYTAVEFRKEQVETNNRATAQYEDVSYTCGDSNNISTLITARGFDMCFTSPPYYDLEVYSKDDMSALGTYEEFMAQYANIFQQCFDMLADNTFCVVKVGEIRDKKTGVYRNFVGDTITTLCNCGFKYYNEIILVNAVGTLRLRVGQSMKTRKVGKMHQNVLVFYKGDPKEIGNKYPQLNFDEALANVPEGEEE